MRHRCFKVSYKISKLSPWYSFKEKGSKTFFARSLKQIETAFDPPQKIQIILNNLRRFFNHYQF